MWFNSTAIAAGQTCTAAVNFLFTPLAYVLNCSDVFYLGSLFLNLGQPARPQFSIAQNLLPVAQARVRWQATLASSAVNISNHACIFIEK